ncbi:phosphate transport system regulatory protein PhoU [Desulfuromonas versatilis]|uniref:Phosphate-specific transport system accessory protein PhoU n=1 Tax=Desulfuromonas versatilis TaxID=2802975 RepID=A0ABN6E354_9BACT|nr:phosphate signaling complex protein PhoU [Desulfuromonas versatilis]BCR06785.1 phosphate transport system regulatory protein PhoU [Desulfuromonas versatilis]
MTQLMQKELDRLKKQLLTLSAVVEEGVQQATRALEKNDVPLAQKVISTDEKINQMEVELEEECLKVLALHQPVAIDLRYIIAVMKINNDLERIGDLASNIAERSVALAAGPRIAAPFDYLGMAGKAQAMLKGSLDCLVQMDTRLAHKVLELDDEIDQQHKDNFSLIKQEILAHPENLEPLSQYLTVSRHLERIADLATNIAEDVYYMIEGEIVRHVKSWGK